MPVYNEEDVVGDVLERVLAEFAVVVCVDDASEDGSASLIAESGATLLRHPLNLGQGAALQTGLTYALGDPRVRYFVTFDADGQHRVDDAVRVRDRLRRGDVDVVFGSRFLDDRTEVAASRRLLLRSAARFMKARWGLRLTDAHNGLRGFNRALASALDIQHNGMAHASEIAATVAAMHLRYAETPVQIRYTERSRAKGQPLLNLVNIAFDLALR
jgi:glycosyltransferase involved in cell wall biosynthesis